MASGNALKIADYFFSTDNTMRYCVDADDEALCRASFISEAKKWDLMGFIVVDSSLVFDYRRFREVSPNKGRGLE